MMESINKISCKCLSHLNFRKTTNTTVWHKSLELSLPNGRLSLQFCRYFFLLSVVTKMVASQSTMLAGVQLYRYIIHLELHKQQTTMFIVISNLKSRTFLYCIITNVFTCSSKDIQYTNFKTQSKILDKCEYFVRIV